jgi:NitT/TauT family transport system permease protein
VANRFNYKGLITALVLLVIWQVISFFTPPYLFPPIEQIAKEFIVIFTSWDIAVHAFSTMARILIGLLFAFIIGTLIGLLMATKPSFDQYVRPLLNFIQGIPALSWVVIAVIWFKDVEMRIFFIVLITSLPNFSLQTFDSYQSIQKDLREMLLVLRPNVKQLFRMLIFPSMAPDLLTAWKVNLGNTTRVAIVAELVGATVGVGFQLSSAQSLFDMPKALAWTLVLVIFVIVVQYIINRIEKSVLSWRPKAER